MVEKLYCYEQSRAHTFSNNYLLVPLEHCADSFLNAHIMVSSPLLALK